MPRDIIEATKRVAAMTDEEVSEFAKHDPDIFRDVARWATPRRSHLESQWIDALDMFIDAYDAAAKKGIHVPDEVRAVAPLAARTLESYGFGSPATRALLQNVKL